MRTRSRLAIAATGVVMCAALTAGVAQAKVYPAEGTAKSDPSIAVSFELDAKVKKGALSRAVSIGRFTADNVPFQCSATGATGRGEYTFVNTFTAPIPVAKNGTFEDVHETTVGRFIAERYTLSGKVKGKGKSALITGTFKAELSEGGLQFNNCATPATPFKAKAATR